jgi:hypothetical protein
MKEAEPTHAIQSTELPRRNFLQLAVLGGGATLLASMLPAGVANAAGNTEALLLSCMDFRLMDDIERYMSARGMRDKYDHIVLAGAAGGGHRQISGGEQDLLGPCGPGGRSAPYPPGDRHGSPRLRCL